MKLLVTGIAGFVGSSIVRQLLVARDDLQVWGIDNLSRRGSERNLTWLRRAGCEVIHGDIRCPSDFDQMPTMDWVVDCAANPSVLAGLSGGSSSLIGHNLVGTLNLLEKCRRDSSGLILISTSRVYSIEALGRIPLRRTDSRFEVHEVAFPDVSNEGIRETFSTAAPVSLYGATKLASEVVALEYGHTFNIPVRINRCGVLAGAGQFGKADQGVFSFWIHSYRSRLPLKYLGFGGSGFQVRDCLHPKDLARLVLLQIEAGSAKDRPGICNVSGGVENSMSLCELSAWCAERFGRHEVASELKDREFDVPWIVLDPALARREWAWEPCIKTERILQEIADHAAMNPTWIVDHS